MKSGRIKKVFTTRLFFNRLVATLILLSFSGLIFADDFESPLPDGFDKKTLTIYMDRADLAESREEWQRIAEYGVDTVTVKWEREYLFVADTFGRGEKNIRKDELKSTLDSIVTKRYKKWLIDKFFSKKVLLNPGLIYREITGANRKYLFETNGDGSLKLDSEGDPVLKTSEDIDEDTASWNMLVLKGLNEALNSLESRGSAWQAELLELIQNDRFIEEDTHPKAGTGIVHEFSSRLALAKKSYKSESNRIFAMEEKGFLAKRKKDQFSLRKKSEEQSANTVAKNIIEDTKQSLSPGFKVLTQNMETSANPLDTEGSEIRAERWREDFRRVFDSGIDKWKRAEKELLLNRMEWEKRAGRAFTKGEKEWEKAYNELVKARQGWQNELNSIVNKGLMLWQNKEDSLSKAIEDSKDELSSSINERTKSLSDQLDGLIDIYLKSASMIKQAEDSIKFWKEDTSSGSSVRVQTWKDIKTKYSSYKREAERKIVDLYGIAVSDGLPEVLCREKKFLQILYPDSAEISSLIETHLKAETRYFSISIRQSLLRTRL